MKFSKDFIFGTGTSAYQIEGAPYEDGKTASIWDTYCSIPGNVYKNHTGNVACDHYHRYKEDIMLLRELGVDSYRLSVSWPRIFPEKGKVNPKGIDFYKRLIEELHIKGIKPMVTLYHWDLPQWADDLGGWLNREIVDWFTQYADVVFKELGSLVPLWITHNEPFCVSMLGYLKGLHAPGHKDLKEALTAAHHILLSHGAAVENFRKHRIKNSEIGITLNLSPGYPATDSVQDIKMAIRADGFVNRWFLDPLYKGQYPQDMVALYQSMIGDLDFIRQNDFDLITQPTDFFGINFYRRNMVKTSSEGLLGYVGVSEKTPQTKEEWDQYPDVLYDLLMNVRQNYTKLPIYITENGIAMDGEFDKSDNDEAFGTIMTSYDGVDYVSDDGKVHDNARILYLQKHLKQLLRFMKDDGNIKGYYAWSLIDNFEWALGYSKRFGLVYVDFETQERVIKDSGYWYKNLIETRQLL